MFDELTSVNEGRAGMYRTLAYLYFKELTQEQLEHIAAQDFAGLPPEEDLVAAGFADMHAYLRRMNSGTRQTLAADYAHTFLAAGNYDSFAATPFESVFTSETGLLMQEARDEVYKAYCAEHVQPREALHTPEDHVSFEFEFMAHLLDRTNEALAAGDAAGALELAQKARDFHAEHLANWVYDLCDAIEDVAQTRFYRGVAKVTRGFVQLEADVCADELAELEEAAAA